MYWNLIYIEYFIVIGGGGYGSVVTTANFAVIFYITSSHAKIPEYANDRKAH